MKIIDDTISVLQEIQDLIGLMLGVAMQFVNRDDKSLSVLLYMIFSSIFVALYIVMPTIDYFKWIREYPQVQASLYAMSSLISIMIINSLIVILPKGFSRKLQRILGVKDED